MFLLLLFFLPAFSIVTPCLAFECPSLREAIASYPDFNSTLLGWRWFTDRGLELQRHYGCRRAAYDGGEPAFSFALGCECPSWAQCTGDDFQYEWQDKRHRSGLGECGCCAGWLVAVLVLSSFFLLIFVLRFHWLRRRFLEWRKKRRVDVERNAVELTAINRASSERESRSENSDEVVGGGALRYANNASLTNRQRALYIGDTTALDNRVAPTAAQPRSSPPPAFCGIASVSSDALPLRSAADVV